VFTSPKAIRFYKTGGPEVLVWEEVRVGNPAPERHACAIPPSA
jgi:hypothetical protein